MKYLFFGDNQYLRKEAINKWKSQFIEKYSDFNVTEIQNISELNSSGLQEVLLTGGFLGEKKLIIIHLGKSVNESLQHSLGQSISKIPKDNIVIFHLTETDKRSKLFKLLKKESETKEFTAYTLEENITFLTNKYQQQLTPKARQTILEYCGNNLQIAIRELDKLLILYPNIDEKAIQQHIIPHFEENIFQIIDEIMNNQIHTAIQKIRIALESNNIYALYNSLLANLRVLVFIGMLKQEKNQDISQILDLRNRAFLIQKTYKRSFSSMKQLYQSLIQIDKKMKTGKLLGSEDADILLHIEKCLIMHA